MSGGRRAHRALAALALGLALLAAPALCSPPPAGGACGERFALTFGRDQRPAVLQQLRDQGYTVHTSGPDYAAVSRCAGGGAAAAALPADAAAAAAAPALPARRGLLESALAAAASGLRRRRALSELAGLGGVAAAEPDVLRFLHRPAPSGGATPALASPGAAGRLALLARRVLRAAAGGSRLAGHWSGAWAGPPSSPYASWELDQTSCSLQDEPLADYAGAEVMPWGIKAIEADSALVPNRTAGSGVTVCVIDSGMWGGHPDLKGNRLSGCGVGVTGAGESGSSPKECPFEWDRDRVAHGTHVAGTIAALSNGRGVVGVIPGGADIFSVRIWNTSGDVSQGQGLFASDLVRAYSACEERLDALKAKAKPGEPRPRMVVSMSFGSAGPLTVERMWFERASKRGDMLFVARCAGSSGGGESRAWASHPARRRQRCLWLSRPCDARSPHPTHPPVHPHPPANPPIPIPHPPPPAPATTAAIGPPTLRRRPPSSGAATPHRTTSLPC
jgi:hypothetical protein